MVEIKTLIFICDAVCVFVGAEKHCDGFVFRTGDVNVS